MQIPAPSPEFDPEPASAPSPEPGDPHNAATPAVGMVFATFDHVHEFYNDYARRVGFGTKIRRSFYSVEDGQCNKFTLTCCKEGKRVYKNSDRCSSYSLRLSARTDCQAKVKVQKFVDGLFHLVEVNNEHNHQVNPSMARFFRSHKATPKKPTKAPPERNGVHNAGFGVDGIGALSEFFVRMQTANTNFFHSMDLDEAGRVKNVFWVDGKARAAYRCYNDVVGLDTTCLADEYETPLVSFVGVNNHGQSVLLGCGLLSTSTSEAYKWLFKVWLSAVNGAPPNAVVTDHCEVVQAAVAEVFPGARHRLCLWRIMKRVKERLGGYLEYKVIKGVMKKAVCESLTADEFEQQWISMTVKYDLVDNQWLKSLYENRRFWVPAFVKDTFWAGMSIPQHKESMISFFDGYIYPKTSLKQFISKYDAALQSRREKEAQADLDSFHKTPQLISKFYMEDQLRKLYTVDMFKKFQEEVKAILYCIPSLVSVDGPISIMEVKEPIYMRDCNPSENKNYYVTYNSNEQDVHCNCGFFQFQGILCRHALSMLNFLEVYEIPLQYILERWRKDFKHRQALTCSPNDSVANGAIERYANLHRHGLKFAEIGAISSESYEFALKTISKATEELVANDYTINGLLSKPCSVNGSTMNGKRNMRSENDEIHNLVQPTRKGYAFKKRKESLVEKVVKSNKRKDSQRKTTDESPNDVLQIAPNTPQFDPHIWTQETINLAEQTSPTNLSIGNQFGVQLNHQHAIETQMNQPGMRWSFQQMFQQTQTTEAPPGSWVV